MIVRNYKHLMVLQHIPMQQTLLKYAKNEMISKCKVLIFMIIQQNIILIFHIFLIIHTEY